MYDIISFVLITHWLAEVCFVFEKKSSSSISSDGRLNFFNQDHCCSKLSIHSPMFKTILIVFLKKMSSRVCELVNI